jgi:chromosome segregation protein
MKIGYIEIVGFRGFRTKTRFDFPSGFAVITGRNGVGKSTAFDALDFVLTGTISKYDVRGAKGGGLEEHLWWIGEKAPEDHYVSVGFTDGNGMSMELTRRRDGSLSSGDLVALAPLLCKNAEEMPSWADTLMRTSLIRDESIAALSFDLSEQARFAAVRAALGAGEVADVGARLKAITKQAEIAKEEQVTRHTKAHEELGRALTALTEARSAVDRQNDVVAAEKLIQAKFDKTLEGGKNYTEAGRQLMNERRQRISAIRSALADGERLQAERSRIETSDFLERLRAQQELLSQTELSLYASRGRAKIANEEFARAQVRDATLSSYLTLLDSGEKVGLQNGHCPLCASPQEQQQFMDVIHAAREILKEKRPEAAEASSDLSAASQEARQIESRLSTLTEELRQMEAQRSRVTENYAELTVRFRDLNIGTPSETGEATQAMLRLQEDLSLIEQATSVVETSGAQDRVASSISKVDQLRAHVEEEATRLTLAERAVERAIQIEKAAKVVGNEIISEQVDTVLPLLKELYQRLRPHADWREIEIDIAGQVRASLNFSVGDGKNPQFLFSSGQRRAAGLAFLLALHLSRPWCGLETLLLDDPVQHVDDYRALNLVEVLSTVRRSGRQVIIAVQDGALADILCRRLRSSLKENGKRFDLGTDLDGSAIIFEEREVAALSRTVFEIAEAS